MSVHDAVNLTFVDLQAQIGGVIDNGFDLIITTFAWCNMRPELSYDTSERMCVGLC